MNGLAHLCCALKEAGVCNQRQLAVALDISIGKCHTLVHEGMEKGYIRQVAAGYAIAPDGKKWLDDNFRVRNAIIYASGINPDFVPFTRQLPKALMETEGERLIERMIRQLNEVGVRDITIIVGHMAERYEYLEDKYGLRVVYNPQYAYWDGFSNIYMVRELLHNTYILQSEYFLPGNLFHAYEPCSWLACYHQPGHSEHWCVETDVKRRVRQLHRGGDDALVRFGPIYIAEEIVGDLVPTIENAARLPGAMATPWQTMLARNLMRLPIYTKVLPKAAVREFRNFEELRDFDLNNTLLHSESTLREIAGIFGVALEEISDLHWIESNAANHVLHFRIRGEAYVCRLPGGEEGRFNTFKQEYYIYKALAGLDLSDSVVYINPETGAKISHYYPLCPLYPAASFEGLRENVAALQRLHQSGARVRNRFNIADRLRHYDILCRRAGCVQFEDYTQTLQRVRGVLAGIADSSAPRVLCHLTGMGNDQITAPDGSLRFAHWEFSGMCHALADVATLGLVAGCNHAQLETLAAWYLSREPGAEERVLLHSYAAACGLLWSLWGEYRSYLGEDFVAYAVDMYRQCKRNLQWLEAVG